MELFKYTITILVMCGIFIAISPIAGRMSAPGTVLGGSGGYVLWGLYGILVTFLFIKLIRS